MARSEIRFSKARPGLLPLFVQILAADFWNLILLGLPFGSDSAVRQRNPSIKAEPNRAYSYRLASVSKTSSTYQSPLQINKTFGHWSVALTNNGDINLYEIAKP